MQVNRMTKYSGGKDLSQDVFKCIQANYEVGACINRILDQSIIHHQSPPADSFFSLVTPTSPITPAPVKIQILAKKRPLITNKRERDVSQKKKKISVDRHVEHAYDAFCVLKQDPTLIFMQKANLTIWNNLKNSSISSRETTRSNMRI